MAMMIERHVAIIAATTLSFTEKSTRSVTAIEAIRDVVTNPNKLNTRTQKNRNSDQATRIVSRRNPLCICLLGKQSDHLAIASKTVLSAQSMNRTRMLLRARG